MASLLGAITALSLAATPGLSFQSTAPYIGVGRPNDGQFTALQVSATAGKVQNAFGDKAVETDIQKFITDRYVPVLTFGPVDSVGCEVSDSYIPVLGMMAYAGLSRSVSDTYTVRATFAYTAISKSGAIGKAASDTYVPVLTMDPATRVQIGAADTYIPVLGMTVTIAKADTVNLTDSYVVVLGMDYTVDAILSAVNWPRSDTYTVSITMNAVNATAGEVDIIHLSERPYGIIRINET
jgi:hypothetical protein